MHRVHPSRSGLLLTGAFLLWTLAACSNGSDSPPPAAVVPPQVVGLMSLVANPNPAVPLAALLSVTSDVPTQIEFTLSDGVHTTNRLADATYRTEHLNMPVLGLRPGREHSVRVLLRDETGQSVLASQVLSITTPALPALFPPITVTTSAPPRMEPGVTLLSAIAARPGSWLIEVDAAGDVVWFLDCSRMPLVSGAQLTGQPLPNGNLMMIVGNQLLMEIDMLGNTVTSWWAARRSAAPAGTIPVDTDTFHHDMLVLPAGDAADFAVLSTEKRALPNYPVDVVDTSRTEPMSNVVGDVIVEFRRDGAVVRRHQLLDLIDPYRLSYDSLGNFWNTFYGVPTRDWSHGNGISYDASDNSLLLSARHQDAVFKIDRASGQLLWIMGDEGRWRSPWNSLLLSPLGADFHWQYHQHAPTVEADGSIWLFDNGDNRAIPPALVASPFHPYSRALQLHVDGRMRTVQHDWSYGGPQGGTGPSFYSFFLCSAYHLPETGNVLICDGGKVDPANGQLFARIYEVTQESSPEVLFEIQLRDPATVDPINYSVYRAYKLPSVYR
jgi:hypothetical protein